MDFFEKAHVVKEEPSRKDKKTSEALKKQIKQMLFGYKQSNSRLIKAYGDDVDPKNLNDDSSSVSGFSDLNLTVSSNEADTTRGTIGSDEDGNISDVDDIVSSNILENLNDSQISNDTSQINTESISEYEDNNFTLSDEFSEIAIDTSSDTNDDLSGFSNISETVSDKDSSDTDFDPKGELATKILEKLEQKNLVKKKNKRRLEPEIKLHQLNSVGIESGKPKIKEKRKKCKNLPQNALLHENDKSADISYECNVTDYLNSPEFVSIEATDIKEQSLSEILGEYKHPTMRNLPTDIQIIDSANNSGNFSIEEMNVEDIQIQEEIDSSTPEYDGQIEEAIIQSTDMDMSIEPQTEDVSVYDDTVESESTSEKEISLVSIDSSFACPVKYYYGDNKCVFVLKHPAELYIHGKVIVKALGGSVELLGYRLKDQPCEVYAPNYNFAQCIKTVVNQNLYKGLFSKLTAAGLSVVDAEEIVTNIGDHDGVISLKKLHNHKMDFVENNMTNTDLFTKIYKNVDVCFKKVSEFLGCSLYLTRQWKTFEEVTCWRKVAEYGLNPVKVLYRLQTHIVGTSPSPAKVLMTVSPARYLWKSWTAYCVAAPRLVVLFQSAREGTGTPGLGVCVFIVPTPSEGQSRGIVCGGKGVGKSTFLRYCVNRLLSQGPVLVVDLDPGQAEFTVAGNISATIVDKPLLGPNFTHLKTPEMMLNLGMINTMDNPRRYASAVGALISHCCNNNQLKSMPWIINTMGLCNSMGLKFMTLTILLAQPTYLLQIDSKNAKRRFEMYLDSYTTRRLYQEDYINDPIFKNIDVPMDLDYSFYVAHHTENPVKKSFSLPARDERYLNFLAYFGNLLTTKKQTDLLGIVPYEVKLGDLHIGLNVRISEDAVTKVINGKIIALCQLMTQDKGGDVFTLSDKPVLCHGHGLVRGVDLEKQMLYIITPMPVEKLSFVNTLVYADWVPELRGQEQGLPDGISVPYRTATMYQKRQLMFAPKRRFNPLQLLKMTRNS